MPRGRVQSKGRSLKYLRKIATARKRKIELWKNLSLSAAPVRNPLHRKTRENPVIFRHGAGDKAKGAEPACIFSFAYCNFSICRTKSIDSSIDPSRDKASKNVIKTIPYLWIFFGKNRKNTEKWRFFTFTDSRLSDFSEILPVDATRRAESKNVKKTEPHR